MQMPTRDPHEAPLEPIIRALPFDQRRARGQASAWLMGLLSVTFALLAGAEPLGLELWLRGILKPLASIGVDARLLAELAMILGASTVVLFALRRQVQCLLDGDQTERAVSELGADFVLAEESLQDLRSEQLDLRTRMERLCVVLDKPRPATDDKTMTDAVFNLAASLDRVHAQLDQSMARNTAGMSADLQNQTQGISQLVERSRDFLQESFEGLEDRLTEAIAAAPPSAVEEQTLLEGENLPIKHQEVQQGDTGKGKGELAQQTCTRETVQDGEAPAADTAGPDEAWPCAKAPHASCPDESEPENSIESASPDLLPEFEILDLGLLEHFDDELWAAEDADAPQAHEEIDLDRIASLRPSDPEPTREDHPPTLAQLKQTNPRFQDEAPGADRNHQEHPAQENWPQAPWNGSDPPQRRPDHGENPEPPPIWDLFESE